MEFYTILTTVGQAAIATAIANESMVNLTEIAVGDGLGNPIPTPLDPATNALAREVYRGAINVLSVDPNNGNWIVAEMVIPSDVGGWQVNEVGLYDNAGTLIAYGNFPQTYKPIIAEGSSRDLVIRMIIEVGSPGAVTLTIDPSVVLATRQWVSDNFSLAIVMPGGTTGQVLRKASNQDGDVEWYDPLAAQNIVVDVVEENQTLAGAQTIVVLAVATTNGVAIYIDGVRLRNDEFTIDDETQITLAVAAAGGEKLTAVQNEPAGANEFYRRDSNLQEIEDAGAAAQAEARGNLGLLTDNTFLDAIYAKVMERQYPVDEIYVTRRAGNPSAWLGFGTWERYGAGKALVGYDAADSSFNALDKTGGSKTHTLTINEMPAHQVDYEKPVYFNQAGGGPVFRNISGGTVTTKSSSVGGGQAHNNLQPYITIYLWKRTA